MFLIDAQGSVRKMDVALIQGKMIRYVHIPDDVDAISNLQKHVSKITKVLEPRPIRA